MLEFGRERDGIDLSKVKLTHHKLNNRSKQPMLLGDGDTPQLPLITKTGSGSVQEKAKVYMEELNELLGYETTDQDQLVYVNQVIRGKMLESQKLRQQAANNTKEQFCTSLDLDAALTNAIVEALDAHTSMSPKALNSDTVRKGLKTTLLNHAGLWELLRNRPAS